MAEWKGTPTPVELPDLIRQPVEAVRSVLQVLLALLNIALAILQVVKAFAFGLLDPILAILEQIIALIEGIINDFRQLGVFAHGDWYLVSWPPTDLQGGFVMYERRMVRRFLDTSDPDRPNISPATPVTAAFFYASAPVDQVHRIIQLINAFRNLFNGPGNDAPPSLPGISDVSVGVGWSNATLISLPISVSLRERNVERRGGVPNTANISWALEGPRSLNPLASRPLGDVGGWFVTVSTFRDGITPLYSRPVSDNTGDGEGSQNYQTGQYTDDYGNTIRIYGGASQFRLTGGVGWNNAYRGGRLVPGSRQCYGVTHPSDTVPIPLEILEEFEASGQPLFQRTFFVEKTTLGSALYLNQRFGFRLGIEDMPWEADFEQDASGEVSVVSGSVRQATTAYIRVQAVSPAIEKVEDYVIDLAPVTSNETATVQLRSKPNGVGFSDVGPISQPVVVTFPSDTQILYIRAIETALAVLALSRPDVSEERVSDITGLEAFAPTVFREMVSNQGPSQFFKKRTKSENFRRSFRRRIQNVADRIYRQQGTVTDDFAQQVIDQVEDSLINWKWRDSSFLSPQEAQLVPDATILESFEGTFVELLEGVCRNKNSIFEWVRSRNEDVRNTVLRRASERGRGLAQAIGESDFVDFELEDTLPIMFGAASDTRDTPLNRAANTGSIWLCRTLFDEEVYNAAATVLQIATSPLGPRDGGWIAFRLVPQGFPGIERVLSDILDWANNFAAGVEGFVAAVLAYVEFIEARIIELQEFIRRLLAYLDYTLGLFIPQANFLLVTGNGTSGVLQEFLGATNKPVDSYLDYGGGVVLVASAPVPGVLTGLINSLLGA